jgi:hypothetical protein
MKIYVAGKDVPICFVDGLLGHTWLLVRELGLYQVHLRAKLGSLFQVVGLISVQVLFGVCT